MSVPALEKIGFGPYRLFPTRRVLERDGVPVELSSRALDILIALVERAGEVVSAKELLSRVWRGLLVDPAGLRVHIAGLRKALGDGRSGVRYVANIPGQGYSFIAPVERASGSELNEPMSESPPREGCATPDLPPLLPRMVGRDEAVAAITDDLLSGKFVTIVGPGGMGKTTVAIAVSHALTAKFEGLVFYVDLSALSDPSAVAGTVARILGISSPTQDPQSAVVTFLKSARALLVLDNCEHLIEAAATLAERLFRETAQVHILATSRERLRVEGERVHWLRPLACPPTDEPLTARQAQSFPSVQLFMDRAAASGGPTALSDEEVSTVARICSGLDGIPLAIELAAGRVGTYGIEGTAGLLNDMFRFRWEGRRTAPRRHQTLCAMLDWSYDLLPESERILLRRLSVLMGQFTLPAARAVATGDEWPVTQVAQALDGLVAKSLLSASASCGTTWYRMLNTTQRYAAEKLTECAEVDLCASRHASYFAGVPHRPESRGEYSCHPDVIGALSAHLANVQSALHWCIREGAAIKPGVRLADTSQTAA